MSNPPGWLILAVAACGSGSSPAVPAQAAKSVRDASAPPDTAPAACLGTGSLYVVAAEGRPRLCTSDPDQCIAIDLATGAISAAEHVDPEDDPPLREGTIDPYAAKPAACYAGKCKPLKKRLRAAIQKSIAQHDAKGDDDADDPWRAPTATTDLRVVAVATDDGAEVWSIDRDRTVMEDKDYGTSNAVPIGSEVFIEATPPIARVFTSRGKLVTDVGTEQTTIRMLDDTRWLALSFHHTLFIFDSEAPKVVHSIELVTGAEPWDTMDSALTVLADKAIVIALQRPGHPEVLVIDPDRAAITRAWDIAACGT